MSAIDIAGLDKAAVLKALFDNSKQQGMGFMDPTGSRPLPIEDAAEYVAQCQKFDYLRGRVLKVDLSKDTFEPYLYDRDNGQGAAAAAIKALRRA